MTICWHPDYSVFWFDRGLGQYLGVRLSVWKLNTEEFAKIRAVSPGARQEIPGALVMVFRGKGFAKPVCDKFLSDEECIHPREITADQLVSILLTQQLQRL